MKTPIYKMRSLMKIKTVYIFSTHTITNRIEKLCEGNSFTFFHLWLNAV